MYYRFAEDLKAIREILGLTQAELAENLGVQPVTVLRNERGETGASEKLLEQAYDFAFRRGIRLGKLKEMLWTENTAPGHRLLFHGSKSGIQGAISVQRSMMSSDFGRGFYAGETYDQAVSFVSGYDRSSVYYLDFDETGLKHKKYGVDQEWMLTIACCLGSLDSYADHPLIRKLIRQKEVCDFIIAPIADNRMFQIINSFVNGELTDEQCRHCLAATNLGNQYVFLSDRSVNGITLLERAFLSSCERDYYKSMRSNESRLGEDKVKLARIQYRGKGRYIDEILA